MAENQLKGKPAKQEQTCQQKQQATPPKEQQKPQALPRIAVEETPALELQPPPRTRAQPMQVPQGASPHPRLKERRASDVIDSGVSSPLPSPSFRQGSLPREFEINRLPSPRSPASDRGYGGSVFSSPVTPATPVRDTTDAARMSEDPGQVDPGQVDPGQTEHSVPSAIMSVERDAEEYNMRHGRRGRAVIFNNDEFQMVGMNTRQGSNVDVKNLEMSFEALQFQVEVHTNKHYAEICTIINRLATEDHSDADCIAIAVLTHGFANGFLLAQDVPYPVHLLWQSFTADKCATLAGKPKLFFIQACRGDKLDAGVTMRRRTETDSGRSTYKIPTHSDFLLAFSAPEGFFSWRNPERGTWFIQCLCDELKTNGQSMDIHKLLTRVARRVALDYESFNDLVPWENQCKQVPAFTSMLIRDLIFYPKV